MKVFFCLHQSATQFCDAVRAGRETTKQLNNYSENVTFSHFTHFENGGNRKHPVA